MHSSQRNLRVLAFLLAFGAAAFILGWACGRGEPAGKAALAAEAEAKPVKSAVIQWADLKENPHGDAGFIRFYCEGQTAVTDKFVTGSYTLKPGMEPHAPHTHVEEEILIVSEGSGFIHLNGKEVPVKKGSVMYVESMHPHGIKNTGKEPLHFYFIKWTKKG
jgi:mannose-6-phosphate isomerase-like protein (cupin superfamily)